MSALKTIERIKVHEQEIRKSFRDWVLSVKLKRCEYFSNYDVSLHHICECPPAQNKTESVILSTGFFFFFYPIVLHSSVI